MSLANRRRKNGLGRIRFMEGVRAAEMVHCSLMNEQAKIVEIRAISLNLTPEVGTDDSVIAVRIVPDGREGNLVFGRSLRPGEEDDGTPIVLNAGERLQFKPNSILISIQDIDRHATPGPDGYAPITNTIWTWLSIGNPTGPQLFQYLLAAARRLDGTHDLLMQISSIMTGLHGGFLGLRGQIFRAISLAEILVVGLGRTVDMLDGLQQHFAITSPLPGSIDSRKAGVRQIRNAFEHIEDRALGQVNGRPHQDALTIFQQRDFVAQGKLTYASHSLDLKTELPQMLVDARNYIYSVAIEVAGPARSMAPALEFQPVA
jgi:hypothetical protein